MSAIEGTKGQSKVITYMITSLSNVADRNAESLIERAFTRRRDRRNASVMALRNVCHDM